MGGSVSLPSSGMGLSGDLVGVVRAFGVHGEESGLFDVLEFFMTKLGGVGSTSSSIGI